MARYGYGASVSGSKASVVASSGGAAPLGLPAQIIVSGASGGNGVYTKTDQAQIYMPAPIPGTFNYIDIGFGYYITSPGNTNNNADYDGSTWVFAEGNDVATVVSQNTSTDANNLPTTGWSPSITITAA